MSAPLPDAAWAITQLVPSPEIAVGGEERGAHVGLRWQVTPLLYSFGVNRRVSPWRAFIAEPMVRQGGSVEAYVSPEWIDEGPRAIDRFALRPGLRDERAPRAHASSTPRPSSSGMVPPSYHPPTA